VRGSPFPCGGVALHTSGRRGLYLYGRKKMAKLIRVNEQLPTHPMLLHRSDKETSLNVCTVSYLNKEISRRFKISDTRPAEIKLV
jgi:hypothetical protein